MMGFMDKAKKLAEQAQEKLDEAQQNFNKGGSTPGQPGVAPEDAASEQPTQGLDPNATPDPFKPIDR
jgi:hypothetical protein